MSNVDNALREIEDTDHEWLVELHNDPLVLYNTRDPRPITLESHMQWWNSIKNAKNEKRMIFTHMGVRAGLVKIYAIDRQNMHCVLGADLHPDFRGKKLAKHMWILLLKYCFVVLGMHRVGLSTMEHNTVARRVYENLGFVEEGRIVHCHFRDGKFQDAICMYVIKNWLPSTWFLQPGKNT